MRTDDSEVADETLVDTGDRQVDASPRLAAGATVDRFVILAAIGEGAVGRVYAAYDPKLDRRVALKLLKRAREPDDDTEVARVRREAQALAKLAHPNVVTVYDVGEHDGRLYLALEHVTGQTLRRWVADSRPPPSIPAIVAAFVAAAHGLLAVHHAGLVHRDVKPDNIMIGADGRVRIMDFGLAREGVEAEVVVAREPSELRGSTTLTRTGVVAGTPAYMAPEQHLGEPFDARTDQFALCVSLWEMLYRGRPFVGDNLATLVLNVTQGVRQPPPSDTAVPGWVRRALERGLEVDPARRYPSLAELIVALEQDPDARIARRRRSLISVLTGGAVASVIGLSWWAASEPPAPPTAAPVDPCAEVESFAAVWDPARSPDSLAAAFARTGSPLAAGSAERVSLALGRFAGEWDLARRDTCEATHVRHEQSEALMDLRIACLDRRRARVAGIVAALETADPELVREAPSVVAKLEPIDACSDPERLRAVTPLPDDPAAAATIAALELRIEALSANVDLGRTNTGLAEVRALAAEADATGYAPVRVDAGLLLAQFEENELGPGPSLVTTRAAYLLALREDLARPAALAAIELLWRTSLDDPMSASLPVWSDHARVLVQRVEPDGMLEAGRRVNEGIIAWNQDDLPRALEQTRAGVEIAEAALGPRAATVGDYRNNLAYMELLLGDEAAAIEEYEAVLAIWTEALGPEHPRLGVAQLSLAEIAWDQGRSDDARALAERALAQIVNAGEGESMTGAYAVYVVAELDREAGRFDAARAGYERVLAITNPSVGAEHWRSAKALAGLGALAFAEGDHEAARARLTAAERIFAPLGAFKREHGRVLVLLAEVELGLGETERAGEHATHARARFVEVGARGRRDLDALDRWAARAMPGRVAAVSDSH